VLPKITPFWARKLRVVGKQICESSTLSRLRGFWAVEGLWASYKGRAGPDIHLCCDLCPTGALFALGGNPGAIRTHFEPCAIRAALVLRSFVACLAKQSASKNAQSPICLSALRNVNYNFAQGVDFTKYKTYKWVSIKNAEKIDEITAGQLTSAIDAELARRGLTKTDADTADLHIAYQTAVGSEKQINAYQTGWGYGPRWRYGGGMSSVSATTTTIYIGQLTLDMYDASKQVLVWRGSATKTLDPKANPEKRTKNIKKAVEKLLKNYPPKVK
jgi:hypothetical protein